VSDLLEEVPYFRGDPDPEWNLTEMAAELRPDLEHPVEIRLSGTCPNCSHDVTFDHPLLVRPDVLQRRPSLGDAELAALGELARRFGLSRHSGEEDVEVLCGCEEKHAGAPEGVWGCGASWYTYVTWEAPA